MNSKKYIYALLDLAVLTFSIIASFLLLNVDGGNIAFQERLVLVLLVMLAVPLFYWLGLYEAYLKVLTFKSAYVLLKSVTALSAIFCSIIWLFSLDFPYSLSVLIWLMMLVGVVSVRLLRSWYLIHQGDSNGSKDPSKNVLIYGAGTAGVQLATLLSFGNKYLPCGFIDDSPLLHDRVLEGYKVYSDQEIVRLIEKYEVEEILLAIPSASRSRRRRILTALEPYPVKVRSLPSLDEIVNCEVTVDDIREVDMADLLGRDPVPADLNLMKLPIAGKVVMVTGAGGSIGSELCRQIVKQSPSMLILIEQHEYSLYSLISELEKTGASIMPVLGSVLDREMLERILTRYKVNTVYHAAAYKHVPMVERNLAAGIENNVMGTYTIANAALAHRVDNFVLISTDKAVRPTNIMGATKRVSELIVQGLDQKDAGTCFSAVRFGNVIGSSGSVIPLFRQQIRDGGPVTVTHEAVTRYFMTISEAAELVIQSGAMAEGGDVFVLDMGSPVKIDEMARHMIHLSGLKVLDETNPDGDIAIEYTSLRPGEKLYEELLIGDHSSPTKHTRIMKANEEALPFDKIKQLIDSLDQALKAEDRALIDALFMNVVEGYVPRTVNEVL